MRRNRDKPRQRSRPNKNRGDRRFKRDDGRESSPEYSESGHTPNQARAARELLKGIGVPEPQPFEPDAFQLEALDAIEHEDVLVTAPTGSGKTWIASEESRRLLEQGKRAW